MMRLGPLILVLFLIPILPSSTHAAADVNAQLYFYARLSGFDDRIPAFYTNEFVFNLRTQEPTNERFRIVLLFVSPNNASVTFDYEYESYRDTDSTQFLRTNKTAFFETEWKWHLFVCGGPFPWDSLCWYALVGSTLPVTTAYQPQIYNTQLVPLSWEISFPRLLPFESSDKSDNAGLVARGIQPSVFMNYMRPGRGYLNWYLVKMTFDRRYVDKLRLGFLFWIPSGGLLGTLLGASIIQLLARRRRNIFRLSLTQSLTLYLSSALFAFPFIFSIVQYAPRYTITIPEYLFYIDAGLAFFLTFTAILGEYKRKLVNATPKQGASS